MSNEKSWPDCTFWRESQDQEHYCGSHWDPFYENVDYLFDELPTIISQAKPFRAFSDMHPGPHKIPVDWTRGFSLCWPNADCGLIITLRIAETANEVVNLFPFVNDGTEARIEVEKVFVWISGLEAQIEGYWNDCPVTFFDISFPDNRAWYEAGKHRNFILSGIAYEAGPPKVAKLALEPDSAGAERLRGDLERIGLGLSDEWKPELHLEDSAIFLPISGWDRDDYQFRGPVREVSPFGDLLGQSGWRVRVTVMRFDDEDADLDVFVTRRAWSSDKPPEVGQDIEGTLWLQGQLSSVS